jgi:hypothetical protein
VTLQFSGNAKPPVITPDATIAADVTIPSTKGWPDNAAHAAATWLAVPGTVVVPATGPVAD